MDLSSPISSVVPSAHGAVLAVLARTNRPLTGRGVAELTGGRVSRSRVSEVLAELVESGVVLVSRSGSANLYVLNREHVAAEAIRGLAILREAFFSRAMRWSWIVRPCSAWIFGSAARGDGGLDSDIDVLVVRPDGVDEDDPAWEDQVRAFSDQVSMWTGNRCSVTELSETEWHQMEESGSRLAVDVHRDGIPIT